MYNDHRDNCYCKAFVVALVIASFIFWHWNQSSKNQPDINEASAKNIELSLVR